MSAARLSLPKGDVVEWSRALVPPDVDAGVPQLERELNERLRRDVQLPAQAIALYPGLLLRAEELSGNWSRAEDLVQDVFLAFVTKPPHPKTATELKHWCRTVLRNLNARRFRDMHGAEEMSYEAMVAAWAHGIEA